MKHCFVETQHDMIDGFNKGPQESGWSWFLNSWKTSCVLCLYLHLHLRYLIKLQGSATRPLAVPSEACKAVRSSGRELVKIYSGVSLRNRVTHDSKLPTSNRAVQSTSCDFRGLCSSRMEREPTMHLRKPKRTHRRYRASK